MEEKGYWMLDIEYWMCECEDLGVVCDLRSSIFDVGCWILFFSINQSTNQ
jgi:hypothetical protein